MRMYDIIRKKRDNNELSREEIDYFISSYVNGEIPDYQASALLMAIFINGMSNREIAELTLSMAKSGDMIDLSGINGIKVDKHSTGGVGDKTTMIVSPLAAACGVPVAKMSGRGLGHSGGTIDKLESIPGFNISIDMKSFIANVNNIGIALAGQTGNLVPADKKIYALRDVTATVSCIPLIASSIMSKKIASGSDAIVLDVKTGSGAFMKNIDKAFELAKQMVEIGTNLNREVAAIITNMDQPLGNGIGNSIEVIECIETLKGKGPKDLEDLCLTIAGYMIYLGGKSKDSEEGRKMAEQKLKSGEGLEKLKALIKNQSGDTRIIDDYSILPGSSIEKDVLCTISGYISKIDTRQIGISSVVLGAGRETKESIIDYGVGIIIHKKVGDRVEIGESIATIYGNDNKKVEECEKLLYDAYTYSDTPVDKPKMVYGIVTREGVKTVES